MVDTSGMFYSAQSGISGATPEPAALPNGNKQPNVNPSTLQEILSEAVGNYVIIEFLIGTQGIERKEGILTSVGVSWLVLYEEASDTSVVCDMYSVKFVTFFKPGKRPNPQTPNLPHFNTATPYNQVQSQTGKTVYRR